MPPVKGEGVTHEAILDELRAVRQAGERGRAAINRRLDAGTERFDALENAVQPLTDVIKAMGGEEAFKDLAVDAARGLAALAWLGGKLGTGMRWLAAVAAGVGLLLAWIKWVFLDFWKGEL